jgi:TPR repeat protein
MVGQFYLRGVGTPISQADALRWLAAASRQGHAGAMVLLGGQLLQQTQHNNDRADDDDAAHAAELFRRAAAKGNIDAQYNLGVCLRHGIGLRRDDGRAERLYSAAAQQGHLLAQQALRVLQAQYANEEPEPFTKRGPERRKLAVEPG